MDEAAIKLDGTMRTWMLRYGGEAYLSKCLVLKLMSARGTCMVWCNLAWGKVTISRCALTPPKVKERRKVLQQQYIETSPPKESYTSLRPSQWQVERLGRCQDSKGWC